jgi:UDP-glucuronate 4-epimerase
MKILVTGSAGFIGYHLVRRLIARGDEVVGIDSINDYYDPRLKLDRLADCGIRKIDIDAGKRATSTLFGNYSFARMKLEDTEALDILFRMERFDSVCNLAAQAGVRYSLTNPREYVDSNVVGFLNILECCRYNHVGHLVYASSSSVYGLNEIMPFSTADSVDHPISLYAATKKSNELMAHTYSYLFGLPTTGLRFFTVYGPWGRPDMALFIFTKAIIDGRPIDVFNMGDMSRDFTYIDDVIEGVLHVIDRPPKGDGTWTGARPNPSSSVAPYRIYNIGNSSPVKLMEFIEAIEFETGKKAKRNLLPMQAGDIPATWADVADLEKDFGYRPHTPVRQGIKAFCDWYKAYYAATTEMPCY